MIKKIFATIVVLTVFVGIPILAGTAETHYFKNAVITYVRGNYVVAEDDNGYEWEFNKEGFSVDDKVKLYVNTNCTESTREDDVVENMWLR